MEQVKDSFADLPSEAALFLNDQIHEAVKEIRQEIKTTLHDLFMKTKNATTLEEQFEASIEYQSMIFYCHHEFNMHLPKWLVRVSPDDCPNPCYNVGI